jgi:hypothetical protein
VSGTILGAWDRRVKKTFFPSWGLHPNTREAIMGNITNNTMSNLEGYKCWDKKEMKRQMRKSGMDRLFKGVVRDWGCSSVVECLAKHKPVSGFHPHKETLSHTHTRTHALAHTHTRTYTHAHTHTHTHTHTYTRAHTHTHTHAHTHAHTKEVGQVRPHHAEMWAKIQNKWEQADT